MFSGAVWFGDNRRIGMYVCMYVFSGSVWFGDIQRIAMYYACLVGVFVLRQTKQSEKRGLKRSISLSSRSSSSSSSTISSATNPKNDPSGPIPSHYTPNPTPLRNRQAAHAELKQTIRMVRRAPKAPILEILRLTHPPKITTSTTDGQY